MVFLNSLSISQNESFYQRETQFSEFSEEHHYNTRREIRIDIILRSDILKMTSLSHLPLITFF